jgi:hypothetical protein
MYNEDNSAHRGVLTDRGTSLIHPASIMYPIPRFTSVGRFNSTGSSEMSVTIFILNLNLFQEILWFLHSLQRLLRQYPLTCASLSLSSHICSDMWGGSGWIQKLGWLSDGAITLSAFTGMHDVYHICIDSRFIEICMCSEPLISHNFPHTPRPPPYSHATCSAHAPTTQR